MPAITPPTTSLTAPEPPTVPPLATGVLPVHAKPQSAASDTIDSTAARRQSLRVRNTNKRLKVSRASSPLLQGSEPSGGKSDIAQLGQDGLLGQPTEQQNLRFISQHRPYRRHAELQLIKTGAQRLKKLAEDDPKGPIVYHVDFTGLEIAKIVDLCNPYRHPLLLAPTLESLEILVKGEFPILAVVKDQLQGRNDEDIRNFCSDLLSGEAVRTTGDRVLSLVQEPRRRQVPAIDGRISTLLFARELEGNRGFGRTRRYVNFQNDFLRLFEDELDIVAQFSNCAGDVATISWVSNDKLICGTTTHSDSHNQQYNKPGNLLLCSIPHITLRAFPDHRIPRPLVTSGDNSTHEMRQSQDPWLYSSVVSSDYDPVHKRAYTSSFDRTVKVWRTDDDGKLMECLATWHHEGNVNFVVAAKDGSGRVASGADVPAQAVRIYNVNPDNIADSPYISFSCSRTDADIEKWAYHPATMQWGKGKGCQHILAVGYSPRSISGDDLDIPVDKANTGEIMLWDADKACRIPVTTATTANVFEIVWHPVLEGFIAATSPCGLNVEHSTRTQVHIFHRDREREEAAYCEYQSLDCMASDINELTFMPNSPRHAYVTAACTDGKVYVWDTAQPEQPIHILEHGMSLEVFENEHLEKLDTGVKFTAWGKTPDRFYTGASDGSVRVWNVRNRRKPFLRTLLEAPAPISSGAFSPDKAKLAIGDATGRLYLFSLDQRDAPEGQYMTMPNGKRVRIPIPFIPHPEPLPPSPVEIYPGPTIDGEPMTGVVMDNSTAIAIPSEDVDDGGIAAARSLLDSQVLRLSKERTIGVVQGPNYTQTGLFRKDAHENEDPNGPLLSTYAKLQQESLRADRGLRRRSLRRLVEPSPADERHMAAHGANASWERGIDEFKGSFTEGGLEAWTKMHGAVLELDVESDTRDLAYESGSEC